VPRRTEIGWAVVTIPERLERAERVAREAQGPFVVQRPACREDRVLNVANAWDAALAQEADWAGVLEDDVIVCRDFAFRANLRAREAASLGFNVVTFYSSRKLKPGNEGKRWRNKPHREFMGSLCVAMHRNLASALPGFLRLIHKPDLPIDTAIRAFLFHHKLKMAECLPNLVDHDLGLKSTLGHPSKCGGVPVNSKSFRPNAK